MEEFGIRQSVTDFVADIVIICLYPKFLESDDIVVGPRERASNCRYAFMAVFRNVLQAPANKELGDRKESRGGTDQQLRVATRISSMVRRMGRLHTTRHGWHAISPHRVTRDHLSQCPPRSPATSTFRLVRWNTC